MVFVFEQKPSGDETWMRHGNRVQWTRFPCMETEFIELDFCVYKPSLMNSVSIHGNRVHWTRFSSLSVSVFG